MRGPRATLPRLPGRARPEEYRTGLIREGLRRELERREKLTKRSPRGKQ
jgi:hypothetical protein